MSLKTCNNLRRRPPLTKTNTVFISFSKQRLKPCGEVVVLSAKYKDNVEDVQFFVVDPEVESVLSGNICVKRGLLKRVHQLTSDTPLARTTVELFKRLGFLPGRYRIELPDSATPVVYIPQGTYQYLRERKFLKNWKARSYCAPRWTDRVGELTSSSSEAQSFSKI